MGESIVRADDTEKFIQDLILTGGQSTDNSPHTPLIKVCGLTRPDEALACAELGIKAIGLVFYPKSPRNVTTEQATEICRALPDRIITTGVFVDASVEFIMEQVRACKLKAVQLHGNEHPKMVADLKNQGLMVFKALFAGKEPHIDKADQYEAASAILVEYGKGPLPGGNAETWDWGCAKEAGEKQKLIIAGGITPENVADVIASTSPWAVDVSSGVENAPGRKDLDRIKGLIEAVQTH